MIDEAECYGRALLERSIIAFDRAFVWMVRVSIDEADVVRSVPMFEQPKRSHVAPFPGVLDSPLAFNPDSRGLEVTVHLRDDVLRPSVQLGVTPAVGRPGPWQARTRAAARAA